MQVNLDHVLFWMDAIRESKDTYRTLESFWKGQIHSKTWLIDNLRQYVNGPVTIDIHGGWNGVLASLLFQSGFNITKIRNIDIDPDCKETACKMNRIEELENRFEHVVSDMCDVVSTSNIIINTSCEHITQDQYELWLDKLPSDSIIVLQGNNYDIPEHIRIAKDMHEFERQCHLTSKYVGILMLPKYERYMIIGTK